MRAGLDGMAVIVTGAAQGIGRAIAAHAAASGAEALLLTDIDPGGLAAAAGGLSGPRIETVAADLADPGAPERIAAAARSAFGRIDGLVNAAGITDRGGLTDGTAALWDRVFAVNARAVFLLMQTAVADMRARAAPGAIVNIQSMNAHCGTPDLAIYAASKGAVQTLTKNAANACLADRIRVNGVNLGWTLTEAEDRMQAETLGKGSDWSARAGASLPLGRLLVPDEAARAAIYLLSPASAPVTGVSLDVDQTVLGAPAG